jgi:hypothetical protein
MCREDLVHLDDLINKISVATLIIKRLERLGNVTLLEVTDRIIILRLELIDLII